MTPDLEQLRAAGLWLVTKGEEGAGVRVVGGRVIERIRLDRAGRELVVARVTTIHPREDAEQGRVVLGALAPGGGGSSFSVRSRHLALVLRAMTQAHREMRAAPPTGAEMHVVDVPGGLLDLADDRDVDVETVLRAASTALLELGDLERWKRVDAAIQPVRAGGVR